MSRNDYSNRRNYASRNNSTSRNSYVGGSAAPKYDVTRKIYEAPKKTVSPAVRKNREKAKMMNLGSVIFLVSCMLVAGGVLINYLTIQAQNTAMVENIASLESELNSIKIDNEEQYSHIMSSVNLDEVKRVAIEELGMQYAKEGQIVKIEGACNDYVRQYRAMP